MKKFSAILTREKFALHPHPSANSQSNGHAGDQAGSLSSDPDNEASTAMGNRLSIQLQSKKNDEMVEYIIRAQNMHTCLRIGAHVAYHHYEHGNIPTTGRNRFEWRFIYKSVTEIYEQKWNPDIWAVVYQNGRPTFKAGEAYPHFLDVIEMCSAYDQVDYSCVIKTVEDMFERAKKPTRVEYDQESILKLSGDNLEARLNIARRGPNGKEVVKSQIRRQNSRDVRVSPCLTAAAAIIEAYQLGFFVAKVNELMHHEMLTLSNPEAVQGDHASRRIIRLEEALDEFEEMYAVAYLPQKPNFEHFSKDVATHFDKLYADKKEERKKSLTEAESPPNYSAPD